MNSLPAAYARGNIFLPSAAVNPGRATATDRGRGPSRIRSGPAQRPRNRKGRLARGSPAGGIADEWRAHARRAPPECAPLFRELRAFAPLFNALRRRHPRPRNRQPTCPRALGGTSGAETGSGPVGRVAGPRTYNRDSAWTEPTLACTSMALLLWSRICDRLNCVISLATSASRMADSEAWMLSISFSL